MKTPMDLDDPAADTTQLRPGDKAWLGTTLYFVYHRVPGGRIFLERCNPISLRMPKRVPPGAEILK